MLSRKVDSKVFLVERLVAYGANDLVKNPWTALGVHLAVKSLMTKNPLRREAFETKLTRTSFLGIDLRFRRFCYL